MIVYLYFMQQKTGYDNVDNCDPRQCIASKMMKSHRIINGIFRKHLKGFDLGNGQLSMLFVITKSGGMTQAGLSEHMFMEKSTVSRNVARMLKKGFIVREVSGIIRITDDGLAMLDEVIPQWELAMTETRALLKQDGEAAVDVLLMSLMN